MPIFRRIEYDRSKRANLCKFVVNHLVRLELEKLKMNNPLNPEN